MKKEREPSGQYSTDSNCEWCYGKGFIPVPDYSMIGELGLYGKAISGMWVFAPKKVTYCHRCYRDGTPRMGDKQERYPTLMESIGYAKYAGPDEWRLMKGCIESYLSLYHHRPAVERLMQEVGLNA